MIVDVEKVIREYINPLVHMSLGTSSDNKPWVCEVHFAYDDNLNLYFSSTEARRHSQDIAMNPNVAGNIVKQHAQGEVPFGVYFEGTAKLLTTEEEQAKAAECIQQRLRPSGNILEDIKQPNGRRLYKISVENWYAFGKIDDQPMQKYQLPWNR